MEEEAKLVPVIDLREVNTFHGIDYWMTIRLPDGTEKDISIEEEQYKLLLASPTFVVRNKNLGVNP